MSPVHMELMGRVYKKAIAQYCGFLEPRSESH